MQNIRQNIVFFLFTTLLLITSCKEQPAKTAASSSQQAKESLLKANRYLVKQEKEEIENYIRRHGWEMQETGSGLRFAIVKTGIGELATEGKTAVLDYSTRLITGDMIYSSTEGGPKVFTIGHGGVESGLEEAVLLMHCGDRARVIIPSHLAFGLLGDDNKVPARSTLIYEIELTELK
ncbi:MAG: FKBP-type peptidyl-prolyl cis-trans isomerase [Bacteroidales bacterium]|nr:FKBP-type peptidyl-prolyl cis-trans isomerase [Bacteroidales bacterium]